MVNPIQEVLDAEARAEAKIAVAEAALVNSRNTAHDEARRIVARNEVRTKAVAQRFEVRSKVELDAEIEKLERASEEELQEFLRRIDKEKDRIAEEVFHQFWPE